MGKVFVVEGFSSEPQLMLNWAKLGLKEKLLGSHQVLLQLFIPTHVYTCVLHIYIHSCEFMHVYTISFIPCQTGRLKPLLRDVPDSIGRLILCNVCVRINNTLHLFSSNLNGIIKTVIQCIPEKYIANDNRFQSFKST